jgi:hypothetical protein
MGSCNISSSTGNPLKVRTIPTPSTISSAIKGSDYVDLQVVSCPTTLAFAMPHVRKQLPATVVASVSKSLAKELVAYSDTSGLMVVLAPKGWACNATYGADGSGGLIVYPHGEHVLLSSWGAGWHLSRSSHKEAITVIQPGGSSAQAVAEACPLFLAAAEVFKSSFGHPCPLSPPSERVRRQSPRVVMFVDPPGVHGIGIPSGGEKPARGVLIYTLPAIPGSYLATCTLAASESALCAAVLDNFTERYGKRGQFK